MGGSILIADDHVVRQGFPKFDSSICFRLHQSSLFLRCDLCATYRTFAGKRRVNSSANEGHCFLEQISSEDFWSYRGLVGSGDSWVPIQVDS